jgi:hypothetical protein
MARARNIKPGFFQNERLADLPPITRLLFIGLWTIADYRGCVEWRPKRIKIQLLPYDECDMEQAANDLAAAGFILRYSLPNNIGSSSEAHFIKIVNFEKHQNPHKQERSAGSELPDWSPPQVVEIGAVDELPNNIGSQPEVNVPLTDSLLLIPDSPNGVANQNEKPPSLPASLESEINTWLDALAPLTGARNRKTMADPLGWRRAVEKAIAEDRAITDFLAVVKAEALRNKASPQFFTPAAVLKIVQASSTKTDKWANH